MPSKAQGRALNPASVRKIRAYASSSCSDERVLFGEPFRVAVLRAAEDAVLQPKSVCRRDIDGAALYYYERFMHANGLHGSVKTPFRFDKLDDQVCQCRLFGPPVVWCFVARPV